MTLDARARLRRGRLRGADLLGWLEEHPAAERDKAIELALGIESSPAQKPLGKDRMGYMPAGIAPIVRTVLDAPIGPNDVFVDLGSGLGKVAMAVHLLTGARAIGIELQPDLAARARAEASYLGLKGVTFLEGDALNADVDDATVVFLYLPFTGDVLAGVMARLEAVARRRDLVICSLGLDLRGFDWIVERPSEEFWLSIYDTRIPGAAPRPAQPPLALAALGEVIARER
jgi:methyltransferase family protein